MTAKNVLERGIGHEARPRAIAARDEAAIVGATPNVLLGRFLGVEVDGRARIEIAGRESEGALPALCATDAQLTVEDTLVLAYVEADPRRVLILGRLQAPRVETSAREKDLVLAADQQITLQCGKSSLILTRAGKLLLRGAYISIRSSGVNRIKGGSVQIN